MTHKKKNQWEHFLLMGCDSQEPGEYERSDAMLIVSVNRSRRFVRITSLMRDLWVDVPGFGHCKINAAAVRGGPELAVKTVNQMLDLSISRYAMLNFDGVVNLIDLIGGVDLNITENERIFINDFIPDMLRILNSDRQILPIETAGNVHLCGIQAAAHMRNRRNGYDYGRTQRQREVLISLFNKVRTDMGLFGILKLIPAGLKCVRTNLSLPEIIGLCFLTRMGAVENISTFRIPAEGTYMEISDGIWRFETDFEANKKLFFAFIDEKEEYGNDLQRGQ